MSDLVLDVLGVVDGSERHGPVKVSEQTAGHVSVREALAALDPRQRARLDSHGLGYLGQCFVAGLARVSEGRQWHSAQYCANRNPIASTTLRGAPLDSPQWQATVSALMEARKLISSRRGVGWAIRRLRLAQKKTLAHLAHIAGMDAPNLSRAERGAQNLTEAALYAIADDLGVTVAELYSLAETGSDEAVRVMGRVGRMEADQVRELESFADYLLTRPSDKPK